MLEIHLIQTRVPVNTAEGRGFEVHRNESEAYIDAERVDTITVVGPARRAEDSLPVGVQSVIRYLDNISGFRLLFVAEKAETLARKRHKIITGEDPWGPDYSPV